MIGNKWSSGTSAHEKWRECSIRTKYVVVQIYSKHNGYLNFDDSNLISIMRYL
jgi:hypothetical protein